MSGRWFLSEALLLMVSNQLSMKDNYQKPDFFSEELILGSLLCVSEPGEGGIEGVGDENWPV